jgi:hypothetical protein
MIKGWTREGRVHPSEWVGAGGAQVSGGWLKIAAWRP